MFCMLFMRFMRSFVQNVLVQTPKFDAKPNPNLNANSNPNPNPMPIIFGKMTLWTSELLPIYTEY